MLNVLLPLALVASASLLALQPELRLAVPLLAGVTAAMAMLLACLLYLGEKGRIALSRQVIIIVALAMRLLFLFSPPQLSDDLYRYLWDGLNLLNGINPYAAAPARLAPPPELAVLHAQINHPQYVTIYPPVAQLLFAGGAALGGTLTGLKGLLVTLDMGLCALLLVMMKRLELPLWRAALYAWHPLPVLEIAGSGHVDGAGLTLLMASFCLLLRGRGTKAADKAKCWPIALSGLLLAAAGLVKLFPFALVPVAWLLTPKGRRTVFIAGFLGGVALLILPFMPHLKNMGATLGAYARNWEFAGFAFTSLRSLSGSGAVARLLLAGVLLVIAATLIFRLAGRINESSSPVEQERHALRSCYGIALALLMLTPTLQPWYALCLAVFLPFCAGPAGLLLCWAVFLTYQVQIPYFSTGKWIESPWVTAAVFLAPLLAGGVGLISRPAVRQRIGKGAFP